MGERRAVIDEKQMTAIIAMYDALAQAGCQAPAFIQNTGGCDDTCARCEAMAMARAAKLVS